MNTLFVLVTCGLLACVAAKVALFTECDESSDDICEINEIRINPCADKDACKLRKGKNTSISFDFTPNFSASKMRSSLFWASSGGDIVFPRMSGADACELTGCPLEAGEKQELNYDLQISKKFPNGRFTLKWKLYDEEDTTQLCCFKTDIILRK